MDRRGKTSCACGTKSGVGTSPAAVDPSYGKICEYRRDHDTKTVADRGPARSRVWSSAKLDIRHMPNMDFPFGVVRDMPYHGRVSAFMYSESTYAYAGTLQRQ